MIFIYIFVSCANTEDIDCQPWGDSMSGDQNSQEPWYQDCVCVQ